MKSYGRAQSLTLLLFAGAWLGAYILLARYGVLLLPSAVAQSLTLTTYLGLVQLLVTAGGVGGALLLTRNAAEQRHTLLPLPFKPNHNSLALLLAPAVYVLAHSTGMYLAFDTLIAELASQGARAVQQQTGEFGRSTALNSLAIVLPFTVFIAPLGEELLFRGGIFGAVQALWAKRSSASPSSATHESAMLDSAPESFAIKGLPRKRPPLMPRIKGSLASGWGALIISSLIFGIMHADTPGGMGIVRLTSASVLGLACGLARLKGASLLPAFTLHAAYNLLALGALRGWFISENWPSKYALPTILIPIACFGLLAAGVLILIEKRFFIEKRSATRENHA